MGVLFITRVHDGGAGGDAYVCFHTCGELQIETFAISSNIYGFSIRVQFDDHHTFFSSLITGIRVKLAALQIRSREAMPDLLEQQQAGGQLEIDVVVKYIRLNTIRVCRNMFNN